MCTLLAEGKAREEKISEDEKAEIKRNSMVVVQLSVEGNVERFQRDLRACRKGSFLYYKLAWQLAQAKARLHELEKENMPAKKSRKVSRRAAECVAPKRVRMTCIPQTGAIQ